MVKKILLLLVCTFKNRLFNPDFVKVFYNHIENIICDEIHLIRGKKGFHTY